MNKWPTKSLGEVVDMSRERIEPLGHPGTFFNYIGLENIEGHNGRLLPYKRTLGAQIKSTKNVFRAGQILYGKLRPYLNKVWLAEEDGICSTDIYVFSPRQERIHPSFAAHFLRSPQVLSSVSNMMAGANLPRVSEQRLLKIPIPLPPLAEQRRIVRILDEAEELRRLRREADRRTADLIPALFREMFGDLVRNPKGWPTSTVGDVTTFITSGSRGWARYYSDVGAKFIRVQNLTGHQLDFTDIAYVSPPDTAESERTRVVPRDLLVSITGVVGLVASVVSDIGEAYVSQHVAILRLQPSVDEVFLAAFLADPEGGQRQFLGTQYGQTKPGLNLSQMRAVKILLPPLPRQREFAARVGEIRAVEERQTKSRRRLDDLAASLLHRAFAGEL